MAKKMRFVNFDFGILLLEFRFPKLCLQNVTQNSSGLVLSLAYQQANNSMTSSPSYNATAICEAKPFLTR
jgi:hypothetical protein